MTQNKMTKYVADIAFQKINPNDLKAGDIMLLKKFFKDELDVSLQGNEVQTDICVSGRNVVCFANMCRELEGKNYRNAWYELIDMLDFHESDDYLSINEIAFIDAALRVFLMEFKSN